MRQTQPHGGAQLHVDLEMIWVEPGTFTMGSPTTEVGSNANETEHEVTLTQGFYLGKYEVTQAQYEAVMTGNTDGLEVPPRAIGRNNPTVLWKRFPGMISKYSLPV